jgi:hypothetical protein
VLSIQDLGGQGFDWKASVSSAHGFFMADPSIGSACPGFAGTGTGTLSVSVAPPPGARPGDADHGTLKVITSAPSIGPIMTDVNARVVAVSFSAAPTQLDFGSVAIGQSATIAITITNTSSVPLLVYPVTGPMLPFSLQYWGPHGEDCCPIPRLAPGESGEMIKLVFAPTQAGVFSLGLDLSAFATAVAAECGSPVHVALAGAGVAADGDADAGA